MANIVFCGDRGILIGLHVAVRSMLEVAENPDGLNLYFVHSDFTTSDKATLQRTIDKSGSRPSIHFVDFNSTYVSHLPSFPGGRMVYARLLIADLLPISRCVYLDFDLIISADVGELYDVDLNGYTLGAVSWHCNKESNERSQLAKLGQSSTDAYYNTGVLLMDLEKWRELDLLNQIFREWDSSRLPLLTADQSLLNYFAKSQITQIPRRFNTTITADRRRLNDSVLRDRIVHFLGRPKPWSTLGYLHGHADLFQAWLEKTAIADFSRPSIFSAAGFRQVRRSPKSFLKVFFKNWQALKNM